MMAAQYVAVAEWTVPLRKNKEACDFGNKKELAASCFQ